MSLTVLEVDQSHTGLIFVAAANKISWIQGSMQDKTFDVQRVHGTQYAVQSVLTCFCPLWHFINQLEEVAQCHADASLSNKRIYNHILEAHDFVQCVHEPAAFA